MNYEIPLGDGAKGAVPHAQNLFKQFKSLPDQRQIRDEMAFRIYNALDAAIKSAASNRNHDVVIALSDLLAGKFGSSNPIDIFPAEMAKYFKSQLDETLRGAFSIGVASSFKERQPETMRMYGNAMIFATQRGFIDKEKILDSFVGGGRFYREIPELLERDGYRSTKEAFYENLVIAKAHDLSGKIVNFKKKNGSPDYDVVSKITDCAGDTYIAPPPATIAIVPSEIAAHVCSRLVQAAAAAGGAPSTTLHSLPLEQTRTMSMLTSCSLQ